MTRVSTVLPGFIVLICCTLSACQSPFLIFPGKALDGEVRQVSSFEFAADYKLLRLEVNPTAPYSVILRVTVIEESLYVDIASSRKWGRYLSKDRSVKVSIGNELYAACAVAVTNEAIKAEFLAGRYVYRLDPAIPESGCNS